MRGLARLVAVLGAVGAGWFILDGGRGRDVELVYSLPGPDAVRLGIQISRHGELVRRAEFSHPGAQVHHRVRLPDGAYDLSWSLDRPGGAARGERTVDVSGDQTIVLGLGR